MQFLVKHSGAEQSSAQGDSLQEVNLDHTLIDTFTHFEVHVDKPYDDVCVHFKFVR